MESPLNAIHYTSKTAQTRTPDVMLNQLISLLLMLDRPIQGSRIEGFHCMYVCIQHVWLLHLWACWLFPSFHMHAVSVGLYGVHVLISQCTGVA